MEGNMNFGGMSTDILAKTAGPNHTLFLLVDNHNYEAIDSQSSVQGRLLTKT